MSTFTYECPYCSAKNVISAGNVGHTIGCLHCRRRVAWEGQTPIPAAETPSVPSRRIRWREVAAGVFCLALALPMLFFGARDALQASRSTAWPSTDGVVISSTIRQAEKHGGGRSAKPAVAAAIRYAYRVNGETYHNDTVRFGRVATARFFGIAEATVKRHPPGPATVYYDPEAPDISVLEPGLHPGNLIGPTGAGLLFTILGGVVLYNGLRRS